jgi:hypothetical protein
VSDYSEIPVDFAKVVASVYEFAMEGLPSRVSELVFLHSMLIDDEPPGEFALRRKILVRTLTAKEANESVLQVGPIRTCLLMVMNKPVVVKSTQIISVLKGVQCQCASIRGLL